MIYKLRKITISFGIIFLASFFFQVNAQTLPDEKLFQEAKILIFDKKWEQAQEKLEELLEKHPDSPWFSQALFYKGKCLEEQRGKEVEALNVYKKYILLKDRNVSLTEDSEGSIIDLAFRLDEKGKKSYLREIETRLSSPHKVVRYYAAHRLSYVKDKKIASKGIPVLKEILKNEQDAELRDRAKIDLLRIDPDALRDFDEKGYGRRARIFHLQIINRWKKEPEFSLNIPWALADLALSAIPEKEKAEMRKEGYDLDKIVKELMEFRGKIIEIKTEKSIIKIWID